MSSVLHVELSAKDLAEASFYALVGTALSHFFAAAVDDLRAGRLSVELEAKFRESFDFVVRLLPAAHPFRASLQRYVEYGLTEVLPQLLEQRGRQTS